MASPESVDVPLVTQVGIFLGAIGTAVAAYVNSRRASKEEKEAGSLAASHLVVETASLADTRPFRDRIDVLITAAERTAKSAEEVVSIQRQILESNDDIMKLLSEQIREQRERQREVERDQVHEMRMQSLMADALKRANERDKHP